MWSLRPRLACGGSKLLRAFPSRCHSGRARPHTWGDLPSRGRKAPDRPGIRRLPLLGNRPRPYPSRPQRHCSRAAGLARHGGNPPAGVTEHPHHPRFTRHVHVAASRLTSREAAMGPLMATGRGIGRLLDSTPCHPPPGHCTTDPKKAGRGIVETRSPGILIPTDREPCGSWGPISGAHCTRPGGRAGIRAVPRGASASPKTW